MELVHLDYLTISEKESDKIINILVVTDHFTKYAQAYIMPSQTAHVTAKVLWEQFLVHYGWPTKILMDQGQSFESKLFKELCQIAKVQKLRMSPYHPETNGSCKRFNGTLISMLGTLDNETKRKWTDYVPSLVHAYNCSKNSVTGFCPYYLMFSHKPILPIDVEYGVTEAYLTNKANDNFARKLKKQLNWAYKVAHENTQKELLRHKKYYDKKMRCMKFDINDIVLVHVKAFGNDHKAADKWEQSPYRVVEQYPNRPIFKVQNMEDHTKIRTLHRNMLYPLKMAQNGTDSEVIVETVRPVLLKANEAMAALFNSH